MIIEPVCLKPKVVLVQVNHLQSKFHVLEVFLVDVTNSGYIRADILRLMLIGQLVSDVHAHCQSVAVT